MVGLETQEEIMKEKEWTVGDLAARYGVTPRTIHRWIAKGLKARKTYGIGMQEIWLIRDSDVRDYRGEK